MKFAAIPLLAVLAATPALAQSADDSDKIQSEQSATTVTPPAENPNVDARTAAADAARQEMYKNKLDAAKAQSKADSAAADRDAALAKAEAARQDKDVIEGTDPQ